MEYVLVQFPEDRGVILDGNPNGRTNETLPVEQGTHLFSLEGDGYTPEEQETFVSETTADHPLKIVFTPA